MTFQERRLTALVIFISAVIAIALVAVARPKKPKCDPTWPDWQCNGSPETNSPRCCP